MDKQIRPCWEREFPGDCRNDFAAIAQKRWRRRREIWPSPEPCTHKSKFMFERHCGIQGRALAASPSGRKAISWRVGHARASTTGDEARSGCFGAVERGSDSLGDDAGIICTAVVGSNGQPLAAVLQRGGRGSTQQHVGAVGLHQPAGLQRNMAKHPWPSLGRRSRETRALHGRRSRAARVPLARRVGASRALVPPIGAHAGASRVGKKKTEPWQAGAEDPFRASASGWCALRRRPAARTRAPGVELPEGGGAS